MVNVFNICRKLVLLRTDIQMFHSYLFIAFYRNWIYWKLTKLLVFKNFTWKKIFSALVWHYATVWMGIRDVTKFSVQNWDKNTPWRSNQFFSVFFHLVYEEFIRSTHLDLDYVFQFWIHQHGRIDSIFTMWIVVPPL